MNVQLMFYQYHTYIKDTKGRLIFNGLARIIVFSCGSSVESEVTYVDVLYILQWTVVNIMSVLLICMCSSWPVHLFWVHHPWAILVNYLAHVHIEMVRTHCTVFICFTLSIHSFNCLKASGHLANHLIIRNPSILNCLNKMVPLSLAPVSSHTYSMYIITH